MVCRIRRIAVKRALQLPCSIILMGTLLVSITLSHAAAKQPALHDPLPPIRANAIDGSRVDTAIVAMKKRVIIVQFASTDQANSIKEIQELANVLKRPLLREIDPLWLLILSKMSDPSQLPELSSTDGIRPTIIHDLDRSILGAFQIIVFPSFIVTDRNQQVVYSLAGPALQFEVLAPAALHLAQGDITQLEFKEILHPPSDAQKHAREKAERFIHLAQRMIERGLHDSAVDLYRQALESDPRSLTAHLALGDLLQHLGNFAEAASHYLKALEVDPQSRAAHLGLAASLIQGESDNPDEKLHVDPPLRQAEAILDLLGKEDPENPRVHYLRGLLFERKKEFQQAAEAFRRAVELCFAAKSGAEKKE